MNIFLVSRAIGLFLVNILINNLNVTTLYGSLSVTNRAVAGAILTIS